MEATGVQVAAGEEAVVLWRACLIGVGRAIDWVIEHGGGGEVGQGRGSEDMSRFVPCDCWAVYNCRLITGGGTSYEGNEEHALVLRRCVR